MNPGNASGAPAQGPATAHQLPADQTDCGQVSGHVAHREQFWTFVLEQAEPWHREHLSRLIGTWGGYNARHFGGRLTRPIILLAEPSTPRRLAQCAAVSSYGARSEIRIRPSLLRGTHPVVTPGAPAEGRFRAVEDVLLHETIHQWQQEVTGNTEDSYHGHGRTFAGKCNEIGAALGLPEVRVRNRAGSRDMVCAHWPHNVRPAEHYLGAWAEHGRPPRAVTEPCTHCDGTGRVPAAS